MPKDDLVYVGHMLDTARLAAAKVAGITRERFDADENLRLALGGWPRIFDPGVTIG
ncbi:MAG: hypothetical protein KAY37_11575 [Phycisphaerae bacterium]|nr:hypothetical protein [Phycisphaerae bacterium]